MYEAIKKWPTFYSGMVLGQYPGIAPLWIALTEIYLRPYFHIVITILVCIIMNAVLSSREPGPEFRCACCGYSLKGLNKPVCPECGKSI